MIAARPGARITAALAALLLLAPFLLLAGCGWNAPGPKVTIYNEDPNAAPGAGGGEAGADTVAVSNNGRHIVRKGETLYAISRAYKVPIRTLIVENDLRPPYELVVGERLRVPQTDIHRVMKGDTLYSVSRQYGVSASELARLNGIQPPYTIKIGQRLAIPGQVTGQATGQATGSVADASSTERGEDEDEPRAGGTIQSADLPPPEGAESGDVTVIEPSQSPAATTAEPPAAQAPAQRESFAYADNGLPLPPDRPNPPVRFVTNIPQPPAIEAGGFAWPVRGRVIASYGSKGRGLYNDGLNIAAPRGTPVRAAQAGVVAYSGEELAGFGKMVLIKHADGHLTAYAHNGDLLVKRGDRIRKGQTIARVGSTGDVDTPQLHFQVRKGRQTLDPMGFLRG